MNNRQVKSRALHVLESSWSDDRGYCWPNPDVYPHMWMWDSCFHSIAWSSLNDSRALIELAHVMRSQFRNGFIPHMVYAGPTISRGPRRDVSSFTQPPVWALAMAWASQQGISLPNSLLSQMFRGLSYFTSQRCRDGVAFVVHPWETGCDDSPRWDSWFDTGTWDRQSWVDYGQQLVASAEFDEEEGDAKWNSQFVCAPSLFNAILSHAFLVASQLTDDPGLRHRSFELGEAMDELMWDDNQQMYVDRPVIGGGVSCNVPVLDGVLSALGSVRQEHALACLEQLRNPSLFAAPFGLRYLPVSHPLYLPDGYWRGPVWPQLTFLAVQASRRWGLDDLAIILAEQGRRGIIQSGWSEYWNPETGHGLGARPQTWAAIAVAM